MDFVELVIEEHQRQIRIAGRIKLALEEFIEAINGGLLQQLH